MTPKMSYTVFNLTLGSTNHKKHQIINIVRCLRFLIKHCKFIKSRTAKNNAINVERITNKILDIWPSKDKVMNNNETRCVHLLLYKAARNDS